MKKIYCAGPLFNAKEKEEMEEIASMLENNGFAVFLPHRDGLELTQLLQTFRQLGLSDQVSANILNRAIFTLDVYQVLDSDGLILNINGRVPDEGAMVEAGIAWITGKKVVIYKNDSRTLINGNDNPLLLGLSNFLTLSDIKAIPSQFVRLFGTNDFESNKSKPALDNSNLEELYNKGASIYSISRNGYREEEICRHLIKILGEAAYVQAV